MSASLAHIFAVFNSRTKSAQALFSISLTPFVEAWAGVEPAHGGFANRSVNHFTTRPFDTLIYHTNLLYVNRSTSVQRKLILLSSTCCPDGEIGIRAGLKIL